jgi:hypothetical protein
MAAEAGKPALYRGTGGGSLRYLDSTVQRLDM